MGERADDARFLVGQADAFQNPTRFNYGQGTGRAKENVTSSLPGQHGNLNVFKNRQPVKHVLNSKDRPIPRRQI